MNTYLVRTIADHALVGVFCANSASKLAPLVGELVEAESCEYLILKANDGLHIGGTFVRVPAVRSDLPDMVIITNDLEHFQHSANDSDIPDARDDALEEQMQEGCMLQDAMKENIPPILEATSSLSLRLPKEETSGWTPLSAILKKVSVQNSSVAPSATALPATLLSPFSGSSRTH